MRIIIALSLIFSVSACVNNIEKYYKADPTPQSAPRIVLNSGPAEILHVDNANALEKIYSLMEEGYMYLGNSAFNGEAASNEHIQAVAQKLGAAKVVFMKTFSNTVDRSFALALPDTQTTYHSGSLGTSSNPSAVNYSGSSTTYGTKTTWISNIQKEYKQEALFFVKRRAGGFGAMVKNLTHEQRKETGSNFGVVIGVVVKESSAFYANLMRDDIIISIDDVEIIDGKHFQKITKKRFGKPNVPVTFYRNGEVYSVDVDIDEEFTPLS